MDQARQRITYTIAGLGNPILEILVGLALQDAEQQAGRRPPLDVQSCLIGAIALTGRHEAAERRATRVAMERVAFALKGAGW